nr:PREDICTED: LOW QUALITY PROTEIN: deleted in lung and esophageal cancer protein 1 [Lepisosteus oculatus]
MLQEPSLNTSCGSEPPMNRHRPASEKTQDISHLLASIFKQLYTSEIIGKDKIANLEKSRGGGNSYHEKYVEELQKVHAEYNRRLAEADMLEKHIIQSRARATAAEERALSRTVEEAGDLYYSLGLPPVKSTFRWCVDNSLLKQHNLICPEDYITEQRLMTKAPRGKSTPGFINPTLSFSKHISRLPQDDGYTEIPPPHATAESLLEESEGSLTLPSTPDSNFTVTKSSNKKSSQARKTVKKEESGSSWPEETAALLKLEERHNLLRNPRFLPPNAHRGGKSLIFPVKKVEKMVAGRRILVEESDPHEPIPVFLANPPIVFFTDYRLGKIYEENPGEGGIVAPGMSCHYTVRFAPDSLADFEDFVLVETQAPYPLVVPIEARRPPPILTLPSVLDCGYCMVGGVKIVEFLCQNEGLSSGKFCIMPKTMWPAANFRSVSTASFVDQPPFGISPSLFELDPGQATVVEVTFFPLSPENVSQTFSIVCDNCQVKDITTKGTGQLIALQLVSVSEGEDRPALGELCDLTAEHFIRFATANPHSLCQKKLVIRNSAHLELPFHWQIMKPNLQFLLPGEKIESMKIESQLATDGAFQINPTQGIFAPHQDHEFTLSYSPHELKDYHSVCHLVLRDIRIPEAPEDSKGNRICSTDQPLERRATVNDVIVMEIEVKGSTEPYKVLLEPYAIHIPGENFIGTTIKRRFKMWNNSKSHILFHWDRISDCHIMEVEPPSGIIEVNECCDLELALTGGKPGSTVLNLDCHIEHHCEPITLVVEAVFKGPKVCINIPALNLGLIRLGEHTKSTIQMTNISQLAASWILQEIPDSDEDLDKEVSQIVIEPCSGLLPALATCSVDVMFKPSVCQHFQTVLELVVENGSGCHLSVQANVQSPQVCLLSCELVFSELYVGVPALSSVRLFNQTLLPAHFSWGELKGKQSSLCSVSFSPSSGTLGPNAEEEIAVELTAYTDKELTDVAALCLVRDMKEPLVLGFFAKAKPLHVTFSLPSDSPKPDSQDPSALVLDFGDVLLKSAVKRQLLIINHTAISAPFSLEAEYFSGRPPSPPAVNSQSAQKLSGFRRPLHKSIADKAEDRAHKEFVNALLSHGKGAGFFVQPSSGTLGPYETQTIEISAFTNMWGQYEDNLICRAGDLDPVFIPVKMSVRGCPLYFQMMGPQKDKQTQGPIIRFGTQISGGDTVSRSLRINNISQYDIRVDWETFNKEKGDVKLVDLVVSCGEAFPLKDVDGNEVLGGYVGPSGSRERRRDWDRISSTGETTSTGETCYEEDTEEESDTDEQTAAMRKVVFVNLRQHEGTVSDYPYCITPQQIIVPAGGSATIHVSFTPLTLSETVNKTECVGFALGYMSLDSELACCIPGKVFRSQGFEQEPLRLDLQAFVKPALLTVEMEEDEDEIVFCARASDLIPEEPHKMMVKDSVLTHNLHLRNSTETPLYFRLLAKPPFSVLHTEAKSSTRSSHSDRGEVRLLFLKPQNNMQVKVAFHNSLSLLPYQSQPEGQLPPGVQLVHSETGERTLQFQQDLVVEYSNKTVQIVPLCARLSLPTLQLSCDSLDFGTCYVGQTRVKEVFLSNRGGSSSYWTALIEAPEKPCGFTVSPGNGVLKPFGYPCSTSRGALQISFIASDSAEYKATVTIHGMLGEQPVRLEVTGKGSYDEKYDSLLPDL